MTTHPKQSFYRWGHKSDAAGAYQIRGDTYDDAVKHGIVHNFSEASPDEIALWLIGEKGAASYIQHEDYASAFMLLNPVWSSLPGGRAQEITGEEAIAFIEDQLATKR